MLSRSEVTEIPALFDFPPPGRAIEATGLPVRARGKPGPAIQAFLRPPARYTFRLRVALLRDKSRALGVQAMLTDTVPQVANRICQPDIIHTILSEFRHFESLLGLRVPHQPLCRL